MSVAKCPACLFLFAARHTTIYMICLLNHTSLKSADVKQHDALVIGAYLHVCHRVLRIESNFRRLRGLPGFMLLIQHRKNVRSYGTTFIKFRYFTSASFSSLSQSAFVIFFQGFFSFVLFSSFAFFSSLLLISSFKLSGSELTGSSLTTFAFFAAQISMSAANSLKKMHCISAYQILNLILLISVHTHVQYKQSCSK